MPFEPTVQPYAVIVGGNDKLPDAFFVVFTHTQIAFVIAIPAKIAPSANMTDTMA